MASGIGERLREARVRRGLDLEEVAERTKIRVPFLLALEEENWDLLPGTAYARAFLRTYAEALGLDPDLVVDEYTAAESQEPEPEAAPGPRLAGRPRRGRRPPTRAARLPRPGWATIAGAGLAAVVLILVVVGLVGGSDEEPAEPADSRRPASSGDGGGGDGDSAREERPSRVTLTLTTTATVWVCVVDQDEQPVVEGVTLAAGEEAGPFRGRAFNVGLGNGAVEMEANGEPVEIPTVANPVGYRLTPGRTVELAPEERPTCT